MCFNYKFLFNSFTVYVVIADTYALVDLVRFMQDIGLFDTGEYLVIALEEEDVYDPNKEYQYIRRGMFIPVQKYSNDINDIQPK